MTEYDKLNQILKGKKILYIPIYSCFDYKTQLLNFKADGNINRFLSTFINCNSFDSINIIEPIEGIDKDWFDNVCKTNLNHCELIPCDLVVKSAKIERNIKFSFDLINFFDKNNIVLLNYDYIICEAQHVFLRLYDLGLVDRLIYWCPVCATDDKTRDFLEPYKELDKHIFSISRISIVASKDQVEYYDKYEFNRQLIQIEQLIDRKLPIFDYDINKDIVSKMQSYKDIKKIYLPFRLTDMGYKTKEIIDCLYNKENKDFIVFYSNPNNCDINLFAENDLDKMSFLSQYFIKVSKDRNTFYTIIDHCNVIIPYFEDIDFICHASVDEFKFGNCQICGNLDEFVSILN